MRLDDRPVIDQLLNPTPLNLLHEVEEHMNTLIDGSEYALGDALWVTLSEELAWLRPSPDDGEEEWERFEKSLSNLAGLLADGECSRRQALMELMTREMEARL